MNESAHPLSYVLSQQTCHTHVYDCHESV